MLILDNLNKGYRRLTSNPAATNLVAIFFILLNSAK